MQTEKYYRSSLGFNLGKALILITFAGFLVVVGVVILVNTMKIENRNICLANLAMIHAAKSIYARDNGLTNSVKIPASAIFGEKGYLLRPVCPSEGVYLINGVGTPPACSYHGQASTKDWP